MKVTITEKSPVVRVMEIAVDSEAVEGAYVKAFNDALRHLSIPGFRRGKVPAYMGRKHITNNMLTGQVVDELIPEVFGKAAKENNLRVVSRPQYADVKVERGQELTFTATFDIVPSVEIKDYKGIELTQARYVVTDADVEASLNSTRTSRARLADVADRGLQENDIAYVDFESDEDGKALENGSATNFPMALDPVNYVPGFLEHLYGMKPGEECEFECDFPAEYHSAMAGKHVHFHFKLHQIKVRELPELDDEFAKSVSEFATLEELRAHILEVMTKRAQNQADQGVAEQIYTKLGEQVTDDYLPNGLVDYHVRVYISRILQGLEQRHMTIEQALKSSGRTLQDFQMQAMMIGKGEAKMELIVRAIATQEKLEVSEEDMEEIIAKEAKALGQSQAFVWKRMEKNGSIELLRYSVLRDSVSQLLAQNANVTYITPEEAEKAAAEKAEAEKAEAEKAAAEKTEAEAKEEAPAAE